jgi:hypothetical protein
VENVGLTFLNVSLICNGSSTTVDSMAQQWS